MAAALADRGIERLVVAVGAVEEARLVSGIEVIGAATLAAAAAIVRRRRPRAPTGRETAGDDRATLERSATRRVPVPGEADPGSSPRCVARRGRDAPSRSRSPVATGC